MHGEIGGGRVASCVLEVEYVIVRGVGDEVVGVVARGWELFALVGEIFALVGEIFALVAETFPPVRAISVVLCDMCVPLS